MKNSFFRLMLGAMLVLVGFVTAQDCVVCKKTIKPHSLYTIECLHTYHKRCLKKVVKNNKPATCVCCNAVIKHCGVLHECDIVYQRHGGKLFLCCSFAGIYALLYSITFGSMPVCNGGPSSSSACQWDAIMHQ